MTFKFRNRRKANGTRNEEFYPRGIKRTDYKRDYATKKLDKERDVGFFLHKLRIGRNVAPVSKTLCAVVAMIRMLVVVGVVVLAMLNKSACHTIMMMVWYERHNDQHKSGQCQHGYVKLLQHCFKSRMQRYI